MSNRIIQLTDKSTNDNLYPLAGGMASDSITTAMLQDNSVTSEKIDFTTFELQSIGISRNLSVSMVTWSDGTTHSVVLFTKQELLDAGFKSGDAIKVSGDVLTNLGQGVGDLSVGIKYSSSTASRTGVNSSHAWTMITPISRIAAWDGDSDVVFTINVSVTTPQANAFAGAAMTATKTTLLT